MAENRKSLSEQSKQRTTWILSVMGLIILMLFIVVFCSLRQKEAPVVRQQEQDVFTVTSTLDDANNGDSGIPDWNAEKAQLIINPAEVDLGKAILGATAEANVILRAEDAPIVFLQKYLAETTDNGFILTGPCMEKTQLNAGEECVLKVTWTPVTVRNIQNVLTIVWRTDDPRVLRDQRSQIQLRASSTDSKDCVCCEIEKETEPVVPQKGVNVATGEEVEIKDGKVIVDGKEIEVKGEVAIDPDSDIFVIVEPERIALSLDNKFLGRVSDRRTVVDAEGKTIGRLLGDDTLVDSNFNILGAALPLVSVLDAQGAVIGKTEVTQDGKNVRVVDADGEIGTLRVDGSVVDRSGTQIGMLRDWGMAMDLSGELMGAVLPTGVVVNSNKKALGHIQQNGFILDDSGILIGGVVPKGIAVGTGCRSYGTIALNGQVKDSYGQVVGRVMLDRGVVDTNFNELGAAVSAGVIVDMKGQVIGFVNSEGKAVDGKGSLIGCIAPNGVVSAGKKNVGGILQKGKVTSNTCGVLGSVYPDASVMNQDVQPIGKVRSDGYVIDKQNNRLGIVVPRGTVLAEACNLMGVISVTGQVINTKGMSIGCINMSRQAVDTEGREIGKITPTGPVLAADGTLVGRARYDGRIIDKSGKVIDCINPDGSSSVGQSAGSGRGNGAIFDDNGLPTGWTSLAGKCYDERNDEVGTIAFNGWVSDKNGRLIGFMPPNGFVVSSSGSILGNYNALLGLVQNLNGDELGRVMPDWTVLNVDGTEILGALIPSNAGFVDLSGKVIGRLNGDGKAINAEGSVLGKVLADGALYGNDNALLGGMVPTGAVLSSLGAYVGLANEQGDVLAQGTRIGRALSNGLVVTPDNRILGRVWMPMSVLVSGEGVIGTIVPKAVNKSDSTAYQLAGYDKTGNYLGSVSPFGVLLSSDGRLGGRAVPITMVVDTSRRFIGWVNFKGQVVNAEGQGVGVLMGDGLVLDSDGHLVGTVVRKGTVVNSQGEFMGMVGVDGVVQTASGATPLFIGPSDVMMSSDFKTEGRLLPIGLGMSVVKGLQGWTQADGQIANASGVVGRVFADNRVQDGAGVITSGYIPLGAPSVHETVSGIVNEVGNVVSVAGKTLGVVLAPDYTIQNGLLVGRIRTQSVFVRNITNPEPVGPASLDGSVYRERTVKSVADLMLNNFAVDSNKKVMACAVPAGYATAVNLTPLGVEDEMGSIAKDTKVQAQSSGLGITYLNSSTINGGIFAPGLVVDKNGAILGRSNALSDVVDKSGKKIASRMAFDSALTEETIWAGGVIRTGAVIDDYAKKVGAVAADGTLVGVANSFKGRILSDGSAVGVSEPEVYNSMPYVGHLTSQGVPFSYERTIIGRTTLQGDVIDASNKVLFQTLDDGTILGKTRPLEGVILPFRTAVSQQNTVLGIMDGDAHVLSPSGEDVGPVANNGAVKGDHELKDIGGLIPDTLVVNNCKVIGQTAYNGEVVNGQGNTVGRMQPDEWAEDTQGKKLGRSVRYGPVTGLETTAWNYVGRVLPDSTVVNPDGVLIGCAQNDKMVLDSSGEEIGRVRSRGPVFNKEHRMFGRVDAMGRVVGVDNEILGFIAGREDKAYNFEGKEIGWMASREDELFFNPDGTLAKVLSREGDVKDADGNFLFRIDQKTGKIYDKYGNEIGQLGEENYVYLYDMEDHIVARLVGCELKKLPEGNKMGMLLADGTIQDDNGELILSATPDGKVFNPDGTQYGRFSGIGLDLRRCGLSGTNAAASRKIVWGGKPYTVENGMILNEQGEGIGYIDENGRPYWFDKAKPEVIKPREDPRVRPDLPKPRKLTPEERERMVDIVNKRRKLMQKELGKPVEIPGYIKAMAKKHKDKDWGSDKAVSTWPVDMSNVLLADKAIPAVLVRSIDSRYADVPVTAMVERHIYAEEGRRILIPAGSHLIGEASGGAAGAGGIWDTSKIAISWKRLIRPDGAAFKFSATSGDAQGRGGVAAYLDDRFFEKYARPVLATFAEGAVLKATELNQSDEEKAAEASASGETPGKQTRDMLIKNFKDIYDQMIEAAGSVETIVYVPSGTRITVFANTDLWLRSVSDDVEDESKGNLVGNLFESKDSETGDVEPWTKARSKEMQDGAGSDDDMGGDSGASGGGRLNPTPDVDAIYEPELPDDLDNRTVLPVGSQESDDKNYF